MRAHAIGPGPGRVGRGGSKSRLGVARGDVLLALSAVALLLTAIHPRVERALMVRHARAAGDAVETVRDAVRSALRDGDAWPEGAPLGTVPGSLRRHLPQDFSFRHTRYTLRWERWEAPEPEAATAVELPPDDEGPPPGLARQALADSVPPAPPPIVSLGTITLVSEDPRILSALLERFGTSRSFVRESSWTLVLTGGGPP